MTLRVAFDGCCLHTTPHTGVERSFLLALGAFVRGGASCTVFAPESARAYLPRGVDLVALPRRPTWWWRQRQLPSELARVEADVLLSPTAALPARAPCPCIATVHELTDPGQQPVHALRHDVANEQLVQRAARIVVPSQRTASRLARRIPELAPRLRIVPQPIAAEFLEARVVPPGRGFVFVGADRPRKNLTRLIRAWSLLPVETRQPLVLVGPHARRAVPPGVERPGALDMRDLVETLQRARAVVLPSLSEGFGLPALEALALGRAVLGSRDSVTDDLCGDLAVCVDPYDTAAICDGLTRLTQDEDLEQRVRRRGPRLAARFTAARTASGWLAAIEDCVGARAE